MRNSRPIWLLTGLLAALSTGWAANQPPDFPIRCHGTSGMATTSGKNLIVDFRAGDRPAGQSLAAGQCSWLDRGLRPAEPTRIVHECRSVGEAQSSAQLINSGNLWTFWVFNVGRFFHSTASAKGTPKGKPQVIDYTY